MNATPYGWPRLSTAIFYRDAGAMIDWLCSAFGFAIRLKIEGEGGRIEHSEITYGDAVVMVGSERMGRDVKFATRMLSPLSAGGNTHGLMPYVNDVNAHCAQARAHGANIIDEPAVHDCGEQYWADRSYGVIDPEGHLWWFTQRLRNAPAAWQHLDASFDALGDATRFAVLQLLRDPSNRAGELASAQLMARPQLSRHLRVLRGTRLMTDDGAESGAQVHLYRLPPAAVAAMQLWHDEIGLLSFGGRLEAATPCEPMAPSSRGDP